MNRQRSSLLPAIPPTVNDVNIQGAWAETWTHEDFVLDQQNPVDAIIFCPRDDLLRLSECDTVYVDGTFRSTPHTYKQIFTIHGNYMGPVIHLVSCLLNGKRTNDYSYCFSSIRNHILQLTGIDFDNQVSLWWILNNLLFLQ